MKKKRWGLLALVVAGSFFIFSNVFSANSDIVINEIGAYPTSTHEWIEVWNKGADPVDLTGWKFLEDGVRHSLAATGATDSIVAPGEYAVIAQKSEQFLLDHPGFGGSIFGSSWATLSTTGESVGLEDASGTIVEQFVYLAATHFSLERKDPYAADYSSSNWQEHASDNTLGFVNSNFVAAVGGSPSETATPTTTAGVTSTVDVSNAWNGALKINEFVPNPDSGNEWVELYNTSSSTIDLTGGTLCDNRAIGSCTIAMLNESVLPHGFVTIFFASGKLNNDGDSIVLKDAAGNTVDVVRYGSGSIPIPAKNQAGARRSDGVDTDSDSDWAITTQLTLGEANIISAPPAPVQTSLAGGAASQTSQGSSAISNRSFFDVHTVWATVSSSVVINEILPNPSGSDEDDEFIELKNNSGAVLPLVGWQIGTRDKLFDLSGALEAGGFRFFSRSETGVVLPNTTSTEVRLYNSQHQIADSVTYTGAPSGQSYARGANSTWLWTAAITKGAENEFTDGTIENTSGTKTVQPIWKITAPASGKPGSILHFNATKSVDPRGGTLFMDWDFGDGSKLEGANVEHVFLQSGIYQVQLSATSSVGTVGTKKFVVRIAEPGVLASSGVIISELFVDPSGTDSEEFVEVFNDSTTTADVSGFKLQTSEENSFVIPAETHVAPEQFLVFYRLATHLDLANGGGEVDLVSASGTLVDAAVFPKGDVGKSFSRDGAVWKWASAPSPGRFALASEIIEALPPQKVLGTKIKKTAVKTKKTALPPIAVNFNDTENLVSGRPVIARGIVTAVPGVLGKQYFYLSTSEGGMRIYQSKKDFPPLEVGDVVEVTGKISVVAGVKRINIANRSAVDILDTEKGLEPQEIKLNDLGDENAGELVFVQGEITEITGNHLYVDDGDGEIPVYLHTSAKIDKKDFKMQQLVRVTGILEQIDKGWRISPRTQSDIRVTGVAKDPQQAVAGEKISTGPKHRYFSTAIIGGAALAVGAIALNRKRIAGLLK